MFVGQAVVLDTGYSKKPIGRSRGIDDQLSAQLLKLAPSPATLVNHRKGCLEFSSLKSDLIVLSRTVFARQQTESGIEQGAVTRFVVADRQQLAGFSDNPALFAFHVQSEGLLHFCGKLTTILEEIRLPNRGISSLGDCHHAVSASESARIMRAIEIHKKAAIIGVPEALVFLAGLLSHFQPARRVAISFSIGSLFSESRSFELLLYPEFNDRIKRKLVNSQIRTISGHEATVSALKTDRPFHSFRPK